MTSEWLWMHSEAPKTSQEAPKTSQGWAATKFDSDPILEAGCPFLSRRSINVAWNRSNFPSQTKTNLSAPPLHCTPFIALMSHPLPYQRHSNVRLAHFWASAHASPLLLSVQRLQPLTHTRRSMFNPHLYQSRLPTTMIIALPMKRSSHVPELGFGVWANNAHTTPFTSESLRPTLTCFAHGFQQKHPASLKRGKRSTTSTKSTSVSRAGRKLTYMESSILSSRYGPYWHLASAPFVLPSSSSPPPPPPHPRPPAH
ncbi:hypothetical protein D9611_007074 [Ephemerocybe angulata]|uniref:Uncharacterized protein n=1 Tax=Ephemerocybe angulata TaxID=980116 RepID=A0A8H5B0R1_9AGAR|nr:hypothetical protein D9611_007074 [Tulosesus angulatus]